MHNNSPSDLDVLNRHPLLIGMDGGGTTCRAALWHNGQRLDRQVPGANATSDIAGAVAAVRAALDALSAASGLGLAQLATAPAYLGIAGVTGPDVAKAMRDALPFDTCVIEEDRRASVMDALGPAKGCVAVIGTGSFLARQSDTLRFAGGWGLALGDEASGAWLGREACAASLRAIEGLAPASLLTRSLEADFGGRTGLIGFAAQATPRAFAEFAPQVVKARQDPVGQTLLQRGAVWIAETLTTMGWQSGETLCLTGGLGPTYAEFLPTAMQETHCPPRGTAPDGALLLAARVADGWSG